MKTLSDNIKNSNELRFVLLISGILLLFGIFCQAMGVAYNSGGPGLAIERAARSLWKSGTLEAPEYLSLHQRLIQQSSEKQGSYWQDVYAQGKHGKLIPKHAPILAILSAPFVGIFGKFGIWVLMQICIVLAFLSVFWLVQFFSKRSQGKLILMLLFPFSQILVHAYDFGQDILLAALVLSGVSFLRRFPLVGGFLLGSGLWVRPSSLVLCFPLLFAWGREEKKQYLPAFSGFGAAFCLLLIGNIFLYGKGFTSSYHRIPFYVSGTVIFQEHPIGFDLAVFFSDWHRKLLGVEVGLLRYNPFLILLPLILFLKASDSQMKHFLRVVILAVFCDFCFVFSYPMWDATTLGNRFLLPSLLLVSVPITLVVNDLYRKFSRA